MILTDDRGRPLARPCREDFTDVVDFVRAFHTYRDLVANTANTAFDAGLRAALRPPRVPAFAALTVLPPARRGPR